jgi:hypothetical protein
MVSLKEKIIFFMPNNSIPTSPAVRTLIIASAGSGKNYSISFWGQVFFGLLYSLGFFDYWPIGLVIGFILPVTWVICTYRLLKAKASKFPSLPFPAWMQKDPGNAMIIIFDIIFLGLIWFFILAGIYTATWLKLLFTIIFPVLTLIMLRNLVLFDFSDKEKDKSNTRNTNPPSDGI